jgi:hypothetical protein
LLLSVLTVGAVGAALAFGAYAYFTSGSSTAVTVNSSSGLTFTYDIDIDCNGVDASGLSALPPTTTAGPLFPGDTNTVCVTMHNDNTTDVNAYVLNDTFGGSVPFTAALRVKVDNTSDGTAPCPYNTPDSAQYVSGSGCYLGNIAAGGSKTFQATVLFYDDGTDQSALASASATWNTNLNGQTTP